MGIKGLKKFVLAILLIMIIDGLAGCQFKEKFENISQDEENYYLSNSKINVVVDKKTGFIKKVENKITGFINKNGNEGAWPFSMDVGENRNTVEITSQTKNRISKNKFIKLKDSEVLELSYEDLLYEYNGSSTGISAKISLAIGKQDEYISMNLKIDNSKGTNKISAVRFLQGGILTSGSKEETLTAPVWGGGTLWEKPVENRHFKNGVRLGYPGKDMYTLESGWLDLHNNRGGIGVAYINAKSLAMEFSIKSNGSGIEISPILFEPKGILGRSVPLEAGEIFTSDTVIIAPHSGDWHTMADIYRKEYQKAFVNQDGTPDYLTWDSISKKVKESDFMVRFFAGLDGELITTFEDMYRITLKHLNNWYKAENARGDRCMVWIAGQNEKGYAFDVPIMIPAYGPAGGTEGLTKLSKDLHSIGAKVFHYEHPFAVDPDGDGYFKETDPMQRTEHWNLCTHHSVCIDNDIMMNLWKERIIPDIRSTGADGLQFDQGPLQQTICDLRGHRHELDAVSRLSSHSKAVVELSRVVKSTLAEDAFIVSEAFSDLNTRYIDIAQTCWHISPIYGGEFAYTVRQYTFPQFINQYNSGILQPGGYFRNSMLLGGILGGIVCLSDGAPVEIPREYVRFREEIRKAHAPGFPYGFKDNIGIETNHQSLIAKVFTDGEKVTVTYLADNKDIKGKIMVDLNKLGFSESGIKEIDVDIKKNTAGFVILEP